ncbi:peptidase dimerization domain-containing protein, partial [Mycobacterium tuberculosis]|nr:peptidase dimerization domain-containing protein [Mycobacterium tuberculosis]
GMRWYEVTVTGQDAHTGATPMYLRKNALLGAARMIDRIDAIAHEHPQSVGTVGLIENRPNSRNVIPGEVFFTVDFRHPDEAVLDVMETKFRAALAEIVDAQEPQLHRLVGGEPQRGRNEARGARRHAGSPCLARSRIASASRFDRSG